MQTLVELLRHAMRRLVRSPGYSLPVLISLSLGIGLNTAVFSVMDDVVRRPLPFANESRLFAIGMRSANSTSPNATPSEGWYVFTRDVVAWRAQSRTLESFALFNAYPQQVAGPAGAEFIEGAVASDNLLTVLAVQPRLGRWFSSEEMESKARVVVLSHDLWRRQYAESPAALGKTLHIRSEPWTIVGVLPKGGGHPPTAEFWTPRDGMVAGDGMVARLRDGVAPTQMNLELTALSPSIVNLRKGSRAAEIISTPLRDHLYGSARPILRLLASAAALLLLIACANIANLSLARTLERQRELAVRLTLGASRKSLVALVLTENLLLALGGVAVGIVLAVWATRAVVALGPEEISRVPDIGVGGTAMAFAFVLAIGAALLVSIAPVLAASDRGIQPLLTHSGSRVAQSRASRRVRYTLVSTQLAVALLLVTSAGLLIRSVQRLTRNDRLGFSPEGVVVATVPMSGAQTRDEGWRQRFTTDLRERIGALPGVKSVGFGPAPLVGGRGDGLREGFNTILYEQDSVQGERKTVLIFVKHVDPGYYATYGLRLRSGRWLETTDGPTSPAIAVLSASAAKRYFPSGDPIGRTLEQPAFKRMEMTPPIVVGVVDDVLQRDLAIDASPEIYLAVAQQRLTPMPTVAVRVDGATAPIVAALRAVLRDIDPSLATSRLQPMEEIIQASLQRHTFLLLLLGIFAGLGLVLAGIGLYAVISYLVTQRTLEIGIRMALGAQRGDVLALVFREGAFLTVVGLAIGLAAAFAATRLLTSFLFEVQAHDVVTFAFAPIGLALVASVASLIPARRAATVDPVRAIRAD
jgi:predicted permease